MGEVGEAGGALVSGRRPSGGTSCCTLPHGPLPSNTSCSPLQTGPPAPERAAPAPGLCTFPHPPPGRSLRDTLWSQGHLLNHHIPHLLSWDPRTQLLIHLAELLGGIGRGRATWAQGSSVAAWTHPGRGSHVSPGGPEQGMGNRKPWPQPRGPPRQG